MSPRIRTILCAVVFATAFGGIATSANAAIECYKVYRRPACATTNGVPNIHCEIARQRSATQICKKATPRGIGNLRRPLRIRRR